MPLGLFRGVCSALLVRFRHSAVAIVVHRPLGAQCRAAAVLPLLHPTPAVCGTPREAARATVARLEGFDRGYYAGPLGHLSSDGAEFCVAIRSALVSGATVSIYAGAGLVEGSVPRHEWEETQVKMKNFTSLFPSPSAPPAAASATPSSAAATTAAASTPTPPPASRAPRASRSLPAGLLSLLHVGADGGEQLRLLLFVLQ